MALNDWTRYKLDCERSAAAAIETLRESGELAKKGQTATETGSPSLGHLGVDRQRAAEWKKLAAQSEATGAPPADG